MENLDFNRVHRFRYDDLKLLLDVNSGAVHVIDQPTWDFFNYLVINPLEIAFSLMVDQYDYATADRVLDEISSMMMAGQLFTDHHAAEGAAANIAPFVKDFCLQMAQGLGGNEVLTDEEVFAVCKEYEKLGVHYLEQYKNGEVQPFNASAAAEYGTAAADLLHSETCMNCWARLYCNGGCNADLINNNVTEPNGKTCTLQKKRVETAIGVWALLNAEQK